MRLFSYKIDNRTRLQHLVISLDQADADKLKKCGDHKKLRHSIYTFLRKKQVYGGWIIFHPYRIIASKKRELYEASIHDKDLGEFGLWKTLSYIKNWNDFVYYSPHFHVLGVTNHSLPATDTDRYVFKRIRDVHKPSDILGCSMYLLSHIGVNKNHALHNIAWFGKLANAKWSINHATEQTQKYTYESYNQWGKEFAEKEGYQHNITCMICDSALAPILNVHHYLKNFDIKIQQKLKYCYDWYAGSIPPPDSNKIFELLE